MFHASIRFQAQVTTLLATSSHPLLTPISLSAIQSDLVLVISRLRAVNGRANILNARASGWLYHSWPQIRLPAGPLKIEFSDAGSRSITNASRLRYIPNTDLSKDTRVYDPKQMSRASMAVAITNSSSNAMLDKSWRPVRQKIRNTDVGAAVLGEANRNIRFGHIQRG